MPRRFEFLDRDPPDANIRVRLGDGGQKIHLFFFELTNGFRANVRIAVSEFRPEMVQQAHGVLGPVECSVGRSSGANANYTSNTGSGAENTKARAADVTP